ncbi:MAG: DUF1826 domain-containing protein [Sneathiella sp.]|nr:DUF1826 domain-containing protein [Sneathiella sp.]
MSILQTINVADLEGFASQSHQMAIAEREPLIGSEAFFNEALKQPFHVQTKVSNENAEQDINTSLKLILPKHLVDHSFYLDWIEDMAKVARLFCDILETDAIGFWLGTERGCRRFHVDYVPYRLLVTYSGKGTEWLPDAGADRRAFEEGLPNDKIVRDPNALCFMKPWDISIFRGGEDGLLHRTPDDALHTRSLLMRLDHPSFWEKVMRH